MTPHRRIALTSSLLLLTGLIALGVASTKSKLRSAPKVLPAQVPLHFEANAGQTDARVRFLSRGRGYTLFLTPEEAVLTLAVAPDSQVRQKDVREATLRLRLIGADRTPSVEGLDSLPSRSHYFIGNDPKRWRRGIPHYARVRYRDVYPGIDLVYHGRQGQLEYDLVVAPGADPSKVRVAFKGAEAMELSERGHLAITFGGGAVEQRTPAAYQESEGARTVVPAKYVLTGPREFGFALGEYDRSRPLVIDPILAYSTYLGGDADDFGMAIAADASGNAYVTGQTGSTNFPVANALQPSVKGDSDVFVAKLDSTGTSLVYSTYLGGSFAESGFGIGVDSLSNAYVTGTTNSNDFPTTVDSFQPTFAGGFSDAFVAKLDASGSVLLYSTYLGGGGVDGASAIAVNPAGGAYVTGETVSSDFPTANPLQPTKASSDHTPDAFVAKLDPSGAALVYSTYLGGSSHDGGKDIAVNGAGDAHVAGYTGSKDFQVVNGFQPSLGGGSSDAFVAKLDASGSVLLYSTYMGGSLEEYAQGVAVDDGGSAHVTGWTRSNDFPTLNPLQAENGSATVYKTTDGGLNWIPLGLSNRGVKALAIDPFDSRTLYAGTQTGGVFKSVDAGRSWLAANTGFASTHVEAMVTDPLAPLTVYASSLSFGLFKSIDGAKSWTWLGPSKPHPLVFALTFGSDRLSLYAGIPGSVAKTVDGAMNWVYGRVVATYVIAMAADPLNPLVVYAGTEDYTPTGGGVWKTMDGGLTWRRASNGLVSPGIPRYLNVYAIAVDPRNILTVYSGTEFGVFKSMDGGQAWSRVWDVPARALVIPPGAASAIYAGTSRGVFRSTDGGASWSAASTGLGTLSVLALMIDPAEPSTLYAGTAGRASDAFLAKLDPTGSLVSSTYLGGARDDEGRGIALDRQGNVFLAGITRSPDFPTERAVQPEIGGVPDPSVQPETGDDADAFVVKLAPGGSGLVYSTYLGGAIFDAAQGIAVDAAGIAYVVGQTSSPDFPTATPLQSTLRGGGFFNRDAFVAKIRE